LKKKALIFGFNGILLLTTLISTASAAFTNEKDSAVGAGVFIHEHQGLPHTHYFAFSVQENRNQLQGTFNLVCKSGSQTDIMIKSTEITSLSIQSVQGGLAAVFTGSAMVKMDNGPWQSGWTFTVTAYDLDGAGADMIGVTLFNPQGQVHCSAEPTPLNSGNILIKT
jgi:hypothetical protein